MANDDGIVIRDASTDDVDCLELYIKGSRQAAVSRKDGVVELNWLVDGPQYWPKAKLLMQGLIELTAIAEQWHNGGAHG